jgi:PmbA protein
MSGSIDVFSLAKYGLNLSEKKSNNLKCAEIFYGKNEYINIEIEENSVKNSEIGSDHGISIRVIDRRGSLGFAFTNKLDKISIEKITKSSLKMMNAGTTDLDFKDLPRKYNNYPNVKDLFDENLKYLNIEESMHYVKDLIDICKKDDIAISQSASFSSNYIKTYILNSNDLEIAGKETFCNISSEIIVKDKTSKELASGFDYQTERKLKKLKASKVGNSALIKAKRNLNRIKIKTMKAPLILTPRSAINLILKPIADAVNGESYQNKRCFLVGKRGEKIGSVHLNVEDNGLIDGAVGSAAFDGEGVPCKNKKIIESGIFLETGLLHNSYTAGKEDLESTGNASRSSYSSTPGISSTNFIFKPGGYSKEDIIKDVKKGIILDYTGDRPNITTGDFSALILHGNLIESGEIKDPLNETMVGINLLDLFKRIDAVSKEFEVYGSFQAPYIKIKEANIIGAQM